MSVYGHIIVNKLTNKIIVLYNFMFYLIISFLSTH